MAGRRVSVVITTWNHLDDLLKPCIESIKRNTSQRYNVELIIVANGCIDDTPLYLEQLHISNPDRYKIFVTPEQIGFTKAANIGFKMATADHVVILNNDIRILDFGIDMWLDRLFMQFDRDPMVAATGPLYLHDPNSGRNFLVSFCTMYRMDLLRRFGYYDEIFAPAWGEDIDLCIKFQDAGFKTVLCLDPSYLGGYPIWHVNNASYSQVSEFSAIVARNGKILKDRYNSGSKT